MRFSLILENENGDQIDMTTTANRYMTSKIDGLYPPAGTISISTYAGMDGSYLNNAFIEKRNIVISFEMRGLTIESNRHALYRVVRPSKYIKVHYKTLAIDVYAEGYVETCNIDNFNSLTSGQNSILCPDIYFYSNLPVYAYYGKTTGAFHFPSPESDVPFPLGVYNTENTVSIRNNGDEIGFQIIIDTDTSENAPAVSADSPIIYDAATDEYFQIKGEILKGDRIIITTKTGNKTVTLIRNGIAENIINRLTVGSTWLTLRQGENRFRIDGGINLKITFMHTDAYLGV